MMERRETTAQLDLFHIPVDSTPPHHGAGGVESSGPVAEPDAAVGLPIARARSTDPITSHEAGLSVRDITGKQQAVLECFRWSGPMTDEKLLIAYRDQERIEQTDSGLRTRRHELCDHGLLRNTGRKGLTQAGRPTIIWEYAHDGIPW